ncbi:hypothetical protein [Hymenobacter negativus]|uniref:Uncharacterized protein n=1 Tax=Hymenobacter negativus TaxID=2795026 RepID=A0ABS3QL85_9BACT|nr:hypothetical protein [Hymenobacter negativus]MBO2012012.1 hypothetical protein [Hymenobacter negativus]
MLLLLSALSKNTGQAVASQPTGLAVTAEIVHVVIQGERLINMPQIIPYLRLNIRNQTNYPRAITIMSCSWADSWVQKGAYGLCSSWLCQKNAPQTITIPVGQALVFYSGLCVAQSGKNEATSFSMGFVDSPAAYFRSWHTRGKEEKELRARAVVYWSNELNGKINFATTPEVAGNDLDQRYYVSRDGK